jgi:hypothetical protein
MSDSGVMGLPRSGESILFGTLFLILACWFIVYNPKYVAVPWGYYKYAEVGLLKNFTFVFSDSSIELMNNLHSKLKTANFSAINYGVIGKVESALFYVYGWIYSALLFLLGVKLYRRRTKVWKKVHTIDSLLESQSTLWRFQRYLIKHNPHNDSKDVTKGVFRMREKPHAFLMRNNVIDGVKDDEGYYTGEISFDSEVYATVLTEQVGKPFQGVSELTLHEKRIFATLGLYFLKSVPLSGFYEHWVSIFNKKVMGISLRSMLNFSFIWWTWLSSDNSFISKKRWSMDEFSIANRRDKLFGDIAYAYNDEFSFKDVEDVVERYCALIAESEEFKVILKEHFFTRTVLRRMLQESRTTGVLPTDYFGWLKMEDRTLWYTLNDLGLPESSAETHGVKSHYDMEKSSARAISAPYLKTAVENAKQYVIDKRGFIAGFYENSSDEFERWEK